MSKDVIKLQNVKKEDMPAAFRAETYFDFKAHPFEHQALLEQADSVYGAILGIDDYITKWLVDTVAKNRSLAKVSNNETPKPAHTVGNFEVLLEAGAVFEPARIIGSSKSDVCYSVYVAKGAKVIGTDLYLDKGSVYIGEEIKHRRTAGRRQLYI